MSEALLIFDGECPFCTASADWARRHVRSPTRFVPFQALDTRRYGISRRQARRVAWWVDELGRTFPGHKAAAHAFIASGPPWSWLGRFMLLPGVSWFAALAYAIVSRIRSHLPGHTPACRRARMCHAHQPGSA